MDGGDQPFVHDPGQKRPVLVVEASPAHLAREY
jgi:hypothetical protein